MNQAEELVALRGQVAELQRALAEEKAGWARAVGHFNGAEMAETVITGVKATVKRAVDPLNERVGLQAARVQAMMKRAAELDDRLTNLLAPRREPGVKRFRHFDQNGCITEVTLRTLRP